MAAVVFDLFLVDISSDERALRAQRTIKLNRLDVLVVVDVEPVLPMRKQMCKQ